MVDSWLVDGWIVGWLGGLVYYRRIQLKLKKEDKIGREQIQGY